MAKKDTSVTRKSENEKKTNNRGEAKKKNKRKSNVVAVIIAVALIAGSVLAVTYLVQRGRNAVQNYQGNVTATQSVETPTGHTVEVKDMPALKSDDKSDGYLDGAVYVWQNKGFEIFKGTVTDAKSYAESINNYKKILGEGYKVYDVVIPSGTEIALPERLSKTFSNNQRENINTVISNLSMEVTPIDVYSILGEKRNENLYYSTDKYWTPLGGYYAYTSIAKSLGVKAVDIKELTSITLEQEFLGSHITATVSKETQNGNPKLLSNPDKVTYYMLPDTVAVQALPQGGEELVDMQYYNTEFNDEASPLDIYATKDCAYTVLTNSEISKEKIAVVSDKFGYSIVPFLCENYNQVHLIDIDNFQRNLKNYLEENEITAVVFLNGIMSANTAAKTAKTDAMF
ncbi:MAG: DHHW family protein [Acutalibacteraceae bacterium]|nr:DHHW family protein [Acutalibacteraceae bacterium]